MKVKDFPGRIRTFSAEQIISFFPIKRTARRVANRENLLLEIDRFTESLSQIKTALDRADKNTLHDLLEKAGKRKRNLTAADKT